MITVYYINNLPELESKDSKVFLFCKENGIECGYDWNNSIGKWTEVYLEEELVMQLDYSTTKEQFIEVVQKLRQQFQSDGIMDLSGEDIWIACEDEELLNQFEEKHHAIFR